jgi:hypothetical protein
VQDTTNSPARVIRTCAQVAHSEAEIRMFQASSAFVSACQEATVAMHALTAKIREMEKKVDLSGKTKVKPKGKVTSKP